MSMMPASEFIITVNVVCIAAMILLAVILCAATRFRGGAGYAALIIIATTVPVYIYNMTRSTGEWETARWAIYPCIVANTLLMPLLWLFVRREAGERIGFGTLSVNFIATGVMAAVAIPYFIGLGHDGMTAFLEAEISGHTPRIINLNTLIVFCQAVVYFILIFRYLARRKRLIADNCSDADLLRLDWFKRLMIIFAVLYAMVVVGVALIPMSDAWLIPILNTLAMSYLAYNLIAHPVTQQLLREEPRHTAEESTVNQLSTAEMEECCRRIDAFLHETDAYKRVDLSLHQLAAETGIAPRTISRSINGHLGRNFFDVVNSMRVAEAERLLQDLDRDSYNIDSIYTECGFRSRSTFFLAFRRIEGTTPAQWLKTHGRAK